MKFTINRKLFLKDLRILKRAICAKTVKTIKVLGSVYLQVTEHDGINFLATDLNTDIQVSGAPQHGSQPGDALVPWKPLFSTIRAYQSESVTIETGEDNKLIVSPSEGATVTRISLENLKEWKRDLPTTDVVGEFIVETGVLGNLLSRVEYAVSLDDTRYVLGGAKMEVSVQEDCRRIRFHATDAHRLSSVWGGEHGVKSNHPDFAQIIPIKALKILRLLDKTSNCVPSDFKLTQMEWDDNWVIFRVGHRYSLRTQMLEGQFPAIHKIHGACKDAAMVRFPRKQWLDTLKRLLAHGYKKGDVVCVYDASKLTLTVATHCVSKQHTDSIEHTYDPCAGDFQGRIAFNPHYLLDFLKTASAETVEIGIVNANTGFRLYDVDWDYRHVLMPMRMPAELEKA